ncbi:1-deoxy-D-xylulose-5-phosphate reductoisomerase [Porphyromonadaceae bacterium W3.11]|nr:1-deoxy-D-xylulose-5-phosphate reductoisomerase [Porphyromonadaceae bacterium W3.11]
MSKKFVTILGSTGSIGTQALQVIACHPEELGVHALVCNNSVEKLIEQALQFKPKVVVTGNPKHEKMLKKALKEHQIEVHSGPEAICDVAGSYQSDIVLTAMVGFSGLAPTIKAIESGKIIALANKETLVVAGDMIKALCHKHKSILLPVDSEHSAIFQCLVGEQLSAVEKIYLTASGGPFLDVPREELEHVTPEQALKHPNWTMGPKVTIDSATLMNKGLEMIEAHHLFNIDPKNIEILVHRQSIIHSMVGYKDGAIKAQLSSPDMRLPIAYALLYPKRLSGNTPLPSLSEMSQLTFEPARIDDFPCLRLAYDALEIGGTGPCVMNAANEVAVQRFLAGQISFTDIPKVIEYTMDKSDIRNVNSLEQLIGYNDHARQIAQAWHK